MSLTTFTQTRETKNYSWETVFAYQAYINNVKNNQLRDQGAFVWEVNPSNRALNRTVVVWPVWTGIAEWSLNGTSRQH